MRPSNCLTVRLAGAALALVLVSSACQTLKSVEAEAPEIPRTRGSSARRFATQAPEYVDLTLPDEALARGLWRVRADTEEPGAALPNVAVSLRVYANAEGASGLRVTPGAVLRSGDALWLELSLPRGGHVYVFQVASDGRVELLYPLALDGDRPARPGALVRVPPPGEVFQLDDAVGAERLLVAVAPTALGTSNLGLREFFNAVVAQRATLNPSSSASEGLAQAYRDRARISAHRVAREVAKGSKLEPFATYDDVIADRAAPSVRESGVVDAAPGQDGIALIDFGFLHRPRVSVRE